MLGISHCCALEKMGRHHLYTAVTAEVRAKYGADF